MRPAALALALGLAAAPLAAQEGPQPALGEGEEIEAEVHADFNGDEIPDLAWVARRGDELRELRVVTSYRSEVEIGENMPQVLALDPYPLGNAALSVKESARGTVLVFEDLTGGTTAVASTHRFRWDTKLEAMRLIGLDATLYSRTFAHNGLEASWNLVTGDLVTRTLRLRESDGDQAYDAADEKRTKRPAVPTRLEDSPSGEDLVWPAAE